MLREPGPSQRPGVAALHFRAPVLRRSTADGSAFHRRAAAGSMVSHPGAAGRHVRAPAGKKGPYLQSPVRRGRTISAAQPRLGVR
jgi:hypothetical protein